MLRDYTLDELNNRRLCCDCVGEDYLKDEIRNQGELGTCSYCSRRSKYYSIETLAERIETVFEQHYVRTSDQPSSYQYAMLADKESGYDWERDGEPVVDAIMNAADIPDEAASDIQKILEDKFYDRDAAEMGEESEFSSDSYYKESDANDERWQDEWREFERSLKTEARFFSRTASHLLTSVFDGIDTMKTRDGRSLIVNAGADTEFSEVFRARSFQSRDSLELAVARPDNHLGSPPSVQASAGRMNALGISVFYGANKPMVALSEVRPPVGSKVVVGRFEIIRPIRLLDLTALNDVTTRGSIFDPTFINRLERTMFLRNLSRRITVPVMPDDETFEYLATQAIADFLATENVPPLDGIIFPSVQTAGESLNVVLFHKSARVQDIDLPEGTTISSSLGHISEDGWDGDYSVFEEVQAKKEDQDKKKAAGFGHLIDFASVWSHPDLDLRPPTLKIDLESVHVHIVEAVKFKTTEHRVRRHRFETREFGL
ncbi:MAG: RES domain-containing protein [Nitrospirae bacterium]|nr:RES domain-containing protein [Nitrospirota bacterium]